MGIEIERKFLVKGNAWRRLVTGKHYRQGYLTSDKDRAVRVRTIGETGYLTIKGISIGASRCEYEYEIPLNDANEMLDNLCLQPLIKKTRYKIPFEGLVWDVDEFGGANQGLIVAEVELETEDQFFVKPDWIGEQVTDDPRYYNANLIAHPFSMWKE